MPDPQLGQEVASTALEGHLRVNTIGDTVFSPAAVMRTAEFVTPLQEQKRPARGWSGDA